MNAQGLTCMLTQDEVEDFQRIYEEEFGEKISYKEAHDRAIEVATLFELILEPPPEANPENCREP